jgi:very-short-patch-repair endonuclease
VKLPAKKSPGEETLALHLKAHKIGFEREVSFVKRPQIQVRFRDCSSEPKTFAVEIDGGNFNGGHSRGKAYEQFCRKINLANSLGWTVYRFTTAMVVSGEAINTILAALGMETK